MARYFVTGATGFLGGHLTEELLRGGHKVVALCRDDEPELEDRGVEVARGDVLDEASIARASRGSDGTFHCAGKVSRRLEDSEELYRLHVEGTRKVAAACKAAGVPRLVLASTSGTVAVSADPSFVANEDSPAPVALLSRWPYYRSKLYAEELALAANDAALEVVVVNPTLLLGPGDLRRSSTEDVRLFLDRRIPATPSGGISFVDVRDAAAGLLLAMEAGAAGRRYLLGARNLTLRELFAKLERVSGVRAPLMLLPRIPALLRSAAFAMTDMASAKRHAWLQPAVDAVSLEMAQFFWYLDASRAERELGWRPRDPMTTLRETVDDILGQSARSSLAPSSPQ